MGFARLDVPLVESRQNDDVIGGYVAVESDVIFFLGGNDTDTNLVEI